MTARPEQPHLPDDLVRWSAGGAAGPIANVAVTVRSSGERMAAAREEALGSIPDERRARPPGWTPKWREALLDGISRIVAGRQLPGAWVPALSVPRFVHGQSQGICDVFGAKVEAQPDGNYFVHPLPGAAQAVRRIRPQPVEMSRYWGAVQWIRYARTASRGRFPFRNPVMVGPLDMASYLLGATRLMEWIYTEPSATHALLQKTTDVIVGMYVSLKDAAGGVMHAAHFGCLSNAVDLCSECRSLVSADVFEEFDAPCLRRIGEALGPYAIHSCGSWERTIPCSLRDPNLKGMNGQVRENDLRKLCVLADGRVLLSIGPSANLPERFTWSDRESFFRYVLSTAPEHQPIEVSIHESEIEVFTRVYRDTRGRKRTEDDVGTSPGAAKVSSVAGPSGRDG